MIDIDKFERLMLIGHVLQNVCDFEIELTKEETERMEAIIKQYESIQNVRQLQIEYLQLLDELLKRGEAE